MGFLRKGDRKSKETPGPVTNTPCPHIQQQLTEKTDDPNEPDIPSHTSPASPLPLCQKCRTAKRTRWTLLVILSLPTFLTSIEATVTSTALTPIATYFDHLPQLGWIVTAYTIPATAFIPFYGQVADIHGRHAGLQLSNLCMLVGSVLCAASQSWEMMLVGRGLQGFASAGVNNLVRIALSDGVDLVEQSKRQTVYSLLAGIGYAVGPVIGGALATSNWRYCFVLPIPIAGLTSVLLFFALRKELQRAWIKQRGAEVQQVPWRQALASFDFSGLLLFVFGVGLLVLGLSWGGSAYPWVSTPVLVTLILGALLFILFWWCELLLEPGAFLSRRFPRQKAMIPWTVFENRDTLLLSVLNTGAGAALYSAFYFISLFWQLAEGYSPQRAGINLLCYTPGIGLGTYLAMYACNIWPRQTFWPLWIGSLIEATGIGTLIWATATRSVAGVNLMMAIAGIGTGIRFMPIILHATAIWPQHTATMISLMDFCVPFGGTIAIAIMSTVFSNKLSTGLGDLGQAGGAPAGLHDSSGIQALQSLPADKQDAVRDVVATAVMWAFVAVLPFLVLSFLAATGLGNVWIKPKDAMVDGGSRGGKVVQSPYLARLFRGRLKQSQSHAQAHDANAATDTSPASPEKVPEISEIVEIKELRDTVDPNVS